MIPAYLLLLLPGDVVGLAGAGDSTVAVYGFVDFAIPSRGVFEFVGGEDARHDYSGQDARFDFEDV